MWDIEFVVGTCLCPRVFLWVFGFIPIGKTNMSNSYILDSDRKSAWNWARANVANPLSCYDRLEATFELRRNPPEVRVTSGQKPSTKIVYVVLKTSVGLFSISSKNNSFLTTPNVENECWTSYETLERSSEMKLMRNFACVCTKALNFEIYFLSFPWEFVFGVSSNNYFLYLALRKCKNDCKILKITLVQIFVF